MCSVFGRDGGFRGSFGCRLLERSILGRLRFVLGHQARLKPHLMSAGTEDGGDTELHLEVEEVVPGVFEKQILELKIKQTMIFATEKSNILLVVRLPAQLTRSRSIVLSRQSSCATTAWLEELVYSRDATSLATCRRVFPSGSSSTPKDVSMGLR